MLNKKCALIKEQFIAPPIGTAPLPRSNRQKGTLNNPSLWYVHVCTYLSQVGGVELGGWGWGWGGGGVSILNTNTLDCYMYNLI